MTPKPQPPIIGPEAGRDARGFLLAWDPGAGCPPAATPPPGGNAPLDPSVNRPRLYTFALDGTLPLPNASAAQ
jgi:hypothetical protein